MLDVHPPHAPTHTWKDFLIHIATIVIGLLIAIGLEQVVEHIHQHEQVKQVREALDLERRQNILIAQQAAVLLREEHDTFSGNLASFRYLRAHPGARLTDLPAPIFWNVNDEPMKVAAWKSLQGSPVAALLPTTELQANSELYRLMDNVNLEYGLVWVRANHAIQYSFSVSDPRDLSPAQLDVAIQATEELLTEHYMASAALENVCSEAKDFGFTPCLTAREINSWAYTVTYSDLPKVFGASGRAYVDRIDALDLQADKFKAQVNALEKRH